MSKFIESSVPQIALLQMLMGNWVSQSIYAAAKLGIADYLQDGEKSYGELATATSTHEESLYRLLRLLASVGIFAEVAPGKFTMTPLADFLRSDVPGSLRDMAIMMSDHEHYSSWGNILYALQTGKSGFEGLFGMNVFEYYAQNPESATIFDRAMTSLCSIENTALSTDYDFSSTYSLVDVGGGQGSLLVSILQANPGITGILFDTLDVIERTKPHIATSGVSDRCQLVSGNFFESIPAGFDAYILKHIIHDWDDERALVILKQCHQAMADNGKVLVVEQVISPDNDPSMGKLMDVNMLVMCPGGKERSAEEFSALFIAAGFKLTKIVPIRGVVSIVEGIKI
ncbi:MAG: methyltransferase [Symploca sp. SIO1B1]|nr:methyltransferase [Symploca sp. SIO1C2]NER92351.1 methyltransferase [Symploca sp. SIO1B1]